MKKYLGGAIGAYAAIVLLLFTIFPAAFGTWLFLTTKTSAASIFLLIATWGVSPLFAIYIKQVASQIYAWGIFKEDCVQIKAWFAEPYALMYEKCNGCGIGYYIHGVLNSQVVGTRMYYIYFSYDPVDKSSATHINLWKPSRTRIKVAYSEKLYDYLLSVLPPNQAKMLKKDHQRMGQI